MRLSLFVLFSPGPFRCRWFCQNVWRNFDFNPVPKVAYMSPCAQSGCARSALPCSEWRTKTQLPNFLACTLHPWYWHFKALVTTWWKCHNYVNLWAWCGWRSQNICMASVYFASFFSLALNCGHSWERSSSMWPKESLTYMIHCRTFHLLYPRRIREIWCARIAEKKQLLKRLKKMRETALTAMSLL